MASIWHSFWRILIFYLASILTFFLASLASILTFYSAILSGIHSGILSGMLFGILFWHYTWHLFWHYCFAGVWLYPCSYLPISCLTVAWPKSRCVTLQTSDLQLLITPPRSIYTYFGNGANIIMRIGSLWRSVQEEFLANLWSEHASPDIESLRGGTSQAWVKL